MFPLATCFTYDRYTTAANFSPPRRSFADSTSLSLSLFRSCSLSLSFSQLGRGRESPRLSPPPLFFFFFRLATSCFLCFRCCGGPFPSRDAGCRHLLQKLRVNPIISRPGPCASALFRRRANPYVSSQDVSHFQSRRHVPPRPFFKLLTTQSRGESRRKLDPSPRFRPSTNNKLVREQLRKIGYLLFLSFFFFFPSSPRSRIRN